MAKEYPGDIYPYAISDYKGTGTFWCKRRHKDGSSLKLHEAERDKYEGVEIQIQQLDNFCASVDGRVLLWLDCEGSEGAVLRGGSRFLDRVDVVNVEMTAAPYNDEWDKPDEIHDWLVTHGFIRQWIHTQRCEQGQYVGIYVKPHLFKPQYCCDPRNTRRMP